MTLLKADLERAVALADSNMVDRGGPDFSMESAGRLGGCKLREIAGQRPVPEETDGRPWTD